MNLHRLFRKAAPTDAWSVCEHALTQSHTAVMPKCVTNLLVSTDFFLPPIMHLNYRRTSSCSNMGGGRKCIQHLYYSSRVLFQGSFSSYQFILTSNSKGVWDSAKFCFHVFLNKFTPASQLPSFNVHNCNHLKKINKHPSLFRFWHPISMKTHSWNTSTIRLLNDMWAPSHCIHPVLAWPPCCNPVTLPEVSVLKRYSCSAAPHACPYYFFSVLTCFNIWFLH